MNPLRRWTMITTVATTAGLLTAGLLPAQAFGGSSRSHWVLPKGILACHRAQVHPTPAQELTFSLSSDEAWVMYVGKGCMTLLVAGGPDNNTVGADLGSYLNVALPRSTEYLVGTKRVSFAQV